MEKIKVFTAFSGYDSQCLALDKLGIDYELVGWSEIDKYAIQAHNALFPQWADRNYGDISKIDWENVPDFDLFSYSFPCTDISNAGRQKGLAKGSNTRSSLLWECQKAIEIKRPKYCLMENVAALVSEKFRPYYLEWERLMCRYGYTNYSRVLNAKDYGIPQNRERIFMVSILDDAHPFYWPEPIPLQKRLKDVLEENVDEKYYLSKQVIDTFNRHADRNKENGNGFGWKPTDGDCITNCVKTKNSRTDDNYIKDI
jgi:DNA (cytosine-5)-methyltransferase 1